MKISLYFRTTTVGWIFQLFQIISPHDKRIQQNILSNLCPWENSWDTSIVSSSSILQDPLQETMCNYMRVLRRDTLSLEMNAACDVTFIYTPMHGVGYPFMVQAFKAANFKVGTNIFHWSSG